MNTSTFLGLRLPEPEDYYSLDGHWNYNSLKIDEYLANVNAAIVQINSTIAGLSAGVKLLGAVNYYKDLPSNPGDGDAYTVRYTGESGTEPLGIEYVYTKVSGVYQWVPLGVDPAVFARQTDLAALQTAVTGKQDELTFDSAPTLGSDNPVKSAGIATAITGEATAREQADAAQNAVLAELIDGKSKNMLDVFSASSGQTATIAGVTWTVNADGTVTANGTATANSFFYILPNNTNITLAQNVTFMSGCPSGGGETTYEMQTVTVGGAIHHDYGEGVEQVGGYSYRYVALTVRSGYTADNLVFKPMICLKDARDLSPEFAPYHPPIADMWAAIRALQAGGGS